MLPNARNPVHSYDNDAIFISFVLRKAATFAPQTPFVENKLLNDPRYRYGRLQVIYWAVRFAVYHSRGLGWLNSFRVLAFSEALSHPIVKLLAKNIL
jgi:hypothetical protein